MGRFVATSSNEYLDGLKEPDDSALTPAFLCPLLITIPDDHDK
jgi:hypothetical protein